MHRFEPKRTSHQRRVNEALLKTWRVDTNHICKCGDHARINPEHPVQWGCLNCDDIVKTKDDFREVTLHFAA